jgi:hypothetical protein
VIAEPKKRKFLFFWFGHSYYVYVSRKEIREDGKLQRTKYQVNEKEKEGDMSKRQPSENVKQ